MTHTAATDRTASHSSLRVAAQQWLAEDPDPATRAQLQALLDSDDTAGLADRFGQRLTFGTAGIRGTLGAGPNRMNRALVRRVTAGLATRLLADDAAGVAATRGVVVGRDARTGSAEFAQDTIQVLAGAGITVYAFDGVVPTPLLAFAVRALGAAAGIEITASHNPATDNGYKVYWSDGAQIIPPLDAEISAAIDAVDHLADVVLASPDDPRIHGVPAEVRAAYVNDVVNLPTQASRDLRIAVTFLHGVAGEVFREVFTAAGFTDLVVVDAQAQPDAAFPTVDFPNPEEPGAMDAVLALAKACDADLAIATDPDGDRFAVAVPDHQGTWTVLSGDQAGCLLADHLLAGSDQRGRVVATTVVSSRLLSRIAAVHEVGYAETLTGFKWLAQVAVETEAAGGQLVMAYEQALGAMVNPSVRDKDGISAALVFADLAVVMKAHSRTVVDALDDLALRFGVHHTIAGSITVSPDQRDAQINGALARVRGLVGTTIGGHAVVAVDDHAAGTRTLAEGGTQSLPTPPTDLVGLTLDNDARLLVRPSGTEPLLKCYVEVIEPVAGNKVASARLSATARADALMVKLLALVRGD